VFVFVDVMSTSSDGSIVEDTRTHGRTPQLEGGGGELEAKANIHFITITR
jgi:hypothetical protein